MPRRTHFKFKKSHFPLISRRTRDLKENYHNALLHKSTLSYTQWSVMNLRLRRSIHDGRRLLRFSKTFPILKPQNVPHKPPISTLHAHNNFSLPPNKLPSPMQGRFISMGSPSQSPRQLPPGNSSLWKWNNQNPPTSQSSKRNSHSSRSPNPSPSGLIS